MRARLSYAGRVVWARPVGIGTPDSPTPAGHFCTTSAPTAPYAAAQPEASTHDLALGRYRIAERLPEIARGRWVLTSVRCGTGEPGPGLRVHQPARRDAADPARAARARPDGARRASPPSVVPPQGGVLGGSLRPGQRVTVTVTARTAVSAASATWWRVNSSTRQLTAARKTAAAVLIVVPPPAPRFTG
jgi:hypothetical protein